MDARATNFAETGEKYADFGKIRAVTLDGCKMGPAVHNCDRNCTKRTKFTTILCKNERWTGGSPEVELIPRKKDEFCTKLILEIG